jgi:hypothetical protein
MTMPRPPPVARLEKEKTIMFDKTFALLAVAVVAGIAFATTPSLAAGCKDELANIEKQLDGIKSAPKRAATRTLWGEASYALKKGDEAGCLAKVGAAIKEGELKASN